MRYKMTYIFLGLFLFFSIPYLITVFMAPKDEREKSILKHMTADIKLRQTMGNQLIWNPISG